MKRPLRFVLVTTFYPPYSFGGDAVHVRALARALAAAGHRVDVIHCVDSYRLQNRNVPDETIEERPGLTVHSLSSGLGPLSPILSHQTGRPVLKTPAINAILDACRPDVIHYHNISLFGPAVLSMLPQDCKPLKLYTLHEYWLVCPTHVLWKFNRRVCDKPECLRCSLLAKRPPQIWRHTGMRERCAAEVDAFLSPTRFAADTHLGHGFRLRSVHFPLFVDAAESETKDASPTAERPYFLFVGRLETVKGAASLIHAWKRMPDVDLWVAGSGSESPRLRKLAAANPRVHFLGQISQEQLGSLYANSLACVVPSAMYEVFPLVVLEAFSRKVPVVARDAGALAEMIVDSGGGLLYRSEDELIAALVRLTQDRRLREDLGHRGHRMVRGAWSKEAHLQRYFALLRETALRKFGTVPWDAEASALSTS